MTNADYTFEEHRHRFAVWAAARASQRGFATVTRLRSALESSGLREALARPATFDADRDEVTVVHREWCRAICDELRRAGVQGVYFGRAAKLVAVYLKTVVLMGDARDSSLARHMHPPVDRILLQTLSRVPGLNREYQRAWRQTNWTRLDEAGYGVLIEQLLAVVTPGAPFWTIEKYWQPSEAEKETVS